MPQAQSTNKPLILITMVACLLAFSSQAANQRRILIGHVPEAVAKLQPVGRLEGSQRLKLAIGVAPRDAQGLDKFIQELYDPASPNYRHYLTSEQFTERFGPSKQDYKALIDYAKASGLNVTHQHANRVVLDVEGAVADIEKALHVTLRTYQHPKEARTFYAPDVEPSLALGVPVLHISGLDNYTRAHPKHTHHSVTPGANATSKEGSAPGGQLWGNDFRYAYVPGSTLTGTGQNVGLLEFEGYYPPDITAYENAIGMSTANRPQMVVVPLDGGATPEDGGDNGEECSIDIEMAVAIAPGLSNIYVFEDGSSEQGNAQFDDIFALMVTYTNILQFSCSWGGDTSQDPTSEVLFKQMAAQGQSFYDASGDAGAFVGAVDFPSDSPSITQVGGTTLTDGSAPSYPWKSEVVWSYDSGPSVTAADATSSSGGISTYYGIPSWQANISMAANLGSTSMRNTPDVAANADNCYIYSDDGKKSGGWGGTSCAAPLWAGFTALINQQAVSNRVAPVGFLNPALYALASGPNYSQYFHDVTSGNNTWAQSPNRFYAVPGYDLCCGLGTMTGMNLINALVPPVFTPVIQAAGYTLSANEPCTNAVVNPGETVTVNLALQNVGGAATTNLVATLLPYLLYRGEIAPGVAASANVLAPLLASNMIAFPCGPQTIGALAPGASNTGTFSFFADGTCGQTITAVVQLQDGTDDLGTVSYSFQLGLPVSTANFTQNFDGISPPALPNGWSASADAGLTNWTTESSTNDGTSTVAYCPDNANPGEVYLYSPTNLLAAGTNQLSFRNYFNLEDTYDGGVLEIAIGNSDISAGNFSDILTAGGSFVTGGYTGILSDAGDQRNENNPLTGRQAWTGTSDGYMTTIVNLPAAASGMNIQLRWICGSDKDNADLSGIGGWWIDDVVISQGSFDCLDCATNVSVPTIVYPTNGNQLASDSSAVVVVTGQAPDDSSVTIYDNGISNAIVSADGNGVYAALVTLNFGSNTLTVTQGATNAGSNVVVDVILAPPTLQIPAVANSPVPVSGTGIAGATVYLSEVGSSSGPIANFLVDVSGNFSGTVVLPPGSYTLTATQVSSGRTSSNATPVLVSVVLVPPPTIVSPVNGFVTNKASLQISGTGVVGAALTVFDVTNGVTNVLFATTVNSTGQFSAVMSLPDGLNTLFATQEQDSTNSPPSALVEVGVYLAPEFLIQPVNQTNFLGGTVTFSAEVFGVLPLKYFWEKDGVKIPGATGPTLTLSNLKAKAANFNYTLTASNAYGNAVSSLVTVVLTNNPFSNLAGNYYGLFTETSAQFESSGLLTLNLTRLGRFTAKILNAGGSYSFSGGLSAVGWWSNIVSRGTAETPLTMVLDLNVANGMDQILGTVSEGTNWSAALEADRATYNTNNLFPSRGKFTLIFGGTSSGAQSPGGDGYGTVNASAAGMVSLKGVLSDNTSIAPGAVSISKYGRWPLYIPLYGKSGSLVGWIDFTNQGASILDLTNNGPCSFAGSNVMWFRTNAGASLYSGGFTNSLTIVGSTYSPGGNSTLLGMPNLGVILSGGDLAKTFSNNVTPLASGKFFVSGSGISGLKLSLNTATGVIQGSFADPAATKAAPIKGVVFQDQTNAGGFFLDAAGSGSFLLTPP